MERHDTPERRADTRREQKRLDELERAVDERDETIRLLNGALSQALADLEQLKRRPAA